MILRIGFLVCTFIGVLLADQPALDGLLAPQLAATVMLDANQGVQVCDTVNTSACWPLANAYVPATIGHKAIFWIHNINAVTLATRNPSPTACHTPCQIMARRGDGIKYAEIEEVDAAGASLSPRKFSQVFQIPMLPVTPLAPGAWKFPIEVMGGDGYHTAVEMVTDSGTPTTGCYIWQQVNNQSYTFQSAGRATGGLHTPYDGKLSVRLWSNALNGEVTAQPWINLNNSTTSSIDQFGKLGLDRVHAIGGTTRTITYWTPITDNSFTAGATIALDYRFNGTDGATSGLRVVKAGVACGGQIAISALSVSSGTATATGTQSWSTGVNILVIGGPKYRGYFNGQRVLTAATGSTLRFRPAAAELGSTWPAVLAPWPMVLIRCLPVTPTLRC
jgi:hypothetical protein